MRREAVCPTMASPDYGKWRDDWEIPVHRVGALQMVPFRKLTKHDFTITKCKLHIDQDSTDYRAGYSLLPGMFPGRVWGLDALYLRWCTSHLSASHRLVG